MVQFVKATNPHPNDWCISLSRNASNEVCVTINPRGVARCLATITGIGGVIAAAFGGAFLWPGVIIAVLSAAAYLAACKENRPAPREARDPNEGDFALRMLAGPAYGTLPR